MFPSQHCQHGTLHASPSLHGPPLFTALKRVPCVEHKAHLLTAALGAAKAVVHVHLQHSREHIRSTCNAIIYIYNGVFTHNTPEWW